MPATCPSVSGHHFSHIKSHFNDLKQNFEIWGYLQKRLFRKVSAATEGTCEDYRDKGLTPPTNSTFSCQFNGANHFTSNLEKLGKIWNWSLKTAFNALNQKEVGLVTQVFTIWPNFCRFWQKQLKHMFRLVNSLDFRHHSRYFWGKIKAKRIHE